MLEKELNFIFSSFFILTFLFQFAFFDIKPLYLTMRIFTQYILLLGFLLLQQQDAVSQSRSKTASEIQQDLQKLDKLGSVLYFAAHPDDENTRLIAWLAQEKKYRTGYLSLTRGDGGQNLLGTDLGIDLGLIRTQELLAARAIDKGEQFFSSAYDFGFSKTHEETFQFWDHEAALREAVWIIRKFQPDVIITRFPPDRRGGHGHHQASAILAHEAFLAAADQNKFPEQLKSLTVWQAKRLVWNTANFGGQNNTSDDQLKVDIGHYSPLLGESYGEIASKSRSQHKTQGFGAASSRGTAIEYFEHVAGSLARETLMDGVETSWKRIPRTANIQQLISKLNRDFQPNNPQQSIDDLIALRKALVSRSIETKNSSASNQKYWLEQKKKEVDDLIIACAGLWADAITPQVHQVANRPFAVQLEAIVRNPGVQAELVAVNGNPINAVLQTNSMWRGNTQTLSNKISQPYWLVEPHTLGKFNFPIESVGYPTNPDYPKATFTFKINNESITVDQEVRQRFVDPVHGELYAPLVVLPPITVKSASDFVLVKNGEEQSIELTFSRHDDAIKQFEVQIDPIPGWQLSQQSLELNFGDESVLTRTLKVKPTSTSSAKGILRLNYKNEPLRYIKTLAYDHIPSLTWFPITEIACQPIALEHDIRHVGYLAGAGDLVPQSLQQIGIHVTPLTEKDLSLSNLRKFDAVVLGVRYYNVAKGAGNTVSKLMEYVQQGGVVVTQYTVNSRLAADMIGPYPFSLGRSRVTEEDAPVSLDAKDPALTFPNKIGAEDFEGWVQERGLYFAEQIDKNYRTPLRMNDKGEQPHAGSLLITKYGKGKFVYTSLSFFRQLPAGVPGAYRLFVNLLANEK